MLFSDIEIMNCTLATANNYLKAGLNAVDHFVFLECERLANILYSSWSSQIDIAYVKRFGV